MRDAEPGLLTRALQRTGRFLLRVPLPLALLIVAGWLVVIWDLSSQKRMPPQGGSLLWEFLSNLAHAPLFGLLALWIAAVLLRERGGGWPRPSWVRGGLVLASVLLYAVVDELHQSRIPGRDASFFDVLTDFVSAGMVLWIVYSLGRGLAEHRLLARLGVGLLLCCVSAALALVS